LWNVAVLSGAKSGLLSALLLIAAALSWGDAAMIHLKAALAPQLIARAWTDTLAGLEAVKPWPWADTWPVARLQVPSLDIDLYVLAGANGASLPFGPGHLSGTAAPGTAGTSVIAGHRDTHFRFLEKLEAGTTISLELASGITRDYRVSHVDIIDARRERIWPEPDTEKLLLVSCKPSGRFDSRGPYRLLVTALPAAPTDARPHPGSLSSQAAIPGGNGLANLRG
jgi:sortase A